MQTRLSLLIIMALLMTHAKAENQKIHWGVPLEYATQTDQVSNTEILPRPNTPIATPDVNNTSTTPTNTESEPEDIAATEERLNNDVRVLWDEIEHAEKQQKQKQNDIKVLPKVTPEKSTQTQNFPPLTPSIKKTPATTTHDIKAEKERLDKLVNSTKDKNGKIVPLPKTQPEKTEKLDKWEKLEQQQPEKLDKADKNKNTKNDKKADKTKNNKQDKANTAPVITVPQQPTMQPKPVLTRKQVLEEEIAREKAALKSAQTQLSIARKRGNMAQVQKLTGVIRDRELNVQAISRELSR